ncbi:MAG: alpha/beta hydrolase [Balneolaceae bacterium]|nr:alpha/beta hydrolase [Balneolaceae bacterium]
MITDHIPSDPAAVESWLQRRENRVSGLRQEARSRIVWGPAGPKRSSCCLVYLHGFKAGPLEGDPVHFRVARRLGCNLLLGRLSGHGLVHDRPLENLRAEDLTASARTALETGLRLGRQVVLMGTSTGATLALDLAGREEYRDRIRALVLYAPLVDFHGIPSRLLKNRHLRRLAARVPGRRFLLRSSPASLRESKIWYSQYALQGLLALGALVERTMTPAGWSRVNQPLFTGWWPGDRVVSVPAIARMARGLGTPEEQLRLAAYPEAGDHVICNGQLSGAVDRLTGDTVDFLGPLLERKGQNS